MKMKNLLNDISAAYGIPEEIIMEVAQTPIDEKILVNPGDVEERLRAQISQSIFNAYKDIRSSK